VTLHELNALPAPDAERALLACCGSRRWARDLAARRPFGSMDALRRAADETWWRLDSADWLEAFSKHPRIGERAAGWSNEEQAAAASAADTVKATLARRNHEYEERFGHVFLVCATGRTAESMLADLEQRMRNEPDAELRVAAGEQAKITRLRLDKLVTSPA
jgi:OHCU decarboxylase